MTTQVKINLVYKYEGDKCGKVLLSEAGDVADEGRCINSNQDNENQTAPQPNPHAKGEVIPFHRPARISVKYSSSRVIILQNTSLYLVIHCYYDLC